MIFVDILLGCIRLHLRLRLRLWLRLRHCLCLRLCLHLYLLVILSQQSSAGCLPLASSCGAISAAALHIFTGVEGDATTDWKTFRCDISAVIVAAFASFGSFARFSARCFRILHASLCWHIEIIFVQHAFICCLRSEHITHTHPKPMQESDCSPIFFQLAHTLTSPRSQFTEQYDINVAYTMFRDNNRYSLNAHNYLRVFLRSVSSQLLIGAWCRMRCAIIDKSFLSECIQSATETTKATASRSWQF